MIIEDLPERDLTGDDKASDGRMVIQHVSPVKLEPYNHERAQEQTRGQIALYLVWLLAIVVLLAFVTLWFIGPTPKHLEQLLTIVFGPLIALVGTAVGYYFGGKSVQAGRNGT